MKNIVFLYTELAEYTMACLEALEQHEDLQIHVVRWPINNEAPFQFRQLPRTKIHDRTTLDDNGLHNLLSEIQPDLILTSGWVDKGYLKLVRNWHKKARTVLLFDNHLIGSMRQWAGTIAARATFIRYFSDVWVPGQAQYRYARKLGFRPERILTEFYCADTKSFFEFYRQHPERQKQLPKRFIFIGRYLEFKGIFELWEAFSAFRRDYPEWELICLGTGDLWDQRAEADGIRHEGFVQPKKLPAYLQETGVFILPSKREPWGVVVHELAAAGFPIICTDCVGAAERFVVPSENGWIIPSGDAVALQKAMTEVASLSDAERADMGKKSYEIAQTLTPEIWAKRLRTLTD